MTKQVVVAAICMLLLASCVPPKPDVKLDGTSKEAYEKSLILIVSGLTSDERMVLSKAIKIVQEHTRLMDQIDIDSNKRSAVNGKTRLEIIEEARKMVLKLIDENKETEKTWNQIFAAINGKVIVTAGDVTERYGWFHTELIIQNDSSQPIKISMAYFKGKVISTNYDEYFVPGETRKILCKYQSVPVQRGAVSDLVYVEVNPIVEGTKRMFQYRLGANSTNSLNDEFDHFLKLIGQERKKPG